MEISRSLDHQTAVEVLRMIGRARGTLREQWEAMEKGTRDSGENLAADKALMDLKWEIIDAMESVPDEA
jgi:hypothetical protein